MKSIFQMNFVFLAVVFLNLGFPDLACAGPKSQISGKTTIERETQWLWQNMSTIIASCLGSKADCIDSEVRTVLNSILKSIPPEPQVFKPNWTSLIEGVHENSHPDLFTSSQNEVHRLAVTSSKPMSKIYFNLDRWPTELDVVLGILIHELAHHQGLDDDSSRLPDRTGAAIATHFKKHFILSTLEPFHLAQFRIGTFNPEAIDLGSQSFYSWLDFTTDFNWLNLQNTAPICDPSEKIQSQMVSNLNWTVNYINQIKGIVRLKAGGIVRTVCQNQTSKSLRQITYPIDARTRLYYPAPLDLQNWMSLIPTVEWTSTQVLSASINPHDDAWGRAQTFLIQQQDNNQSTFRVGDTWKVRMKLQSIDQFQPESCDARYSGTQYSYIDQDSLPWTNSFSTCKITKSTGNSWIIEAELTFSDQMRSDSFYTPIVIMSDRSGSNRTAIPNFPQFVTFQNPKRNVPPKIENFKIMLPVATEFLHLKDISNSFLATPDTDFLLQFDVIGNSEPVINKCVG